MHQAFLRRPSLFFAALALCCLSVTAAHAQRVIYLKDGVIERDERQPSGGSR